NFMLSTYSSKVVSGACAVLGGDDQLLGSLGCYLPRYRFTEENRLQITAAMREAVDKLKHILSCLKPII
ncbi:MAG: hypothetical protein KAS04_03140, partial [Candidatus Aenigmarchaeota archaeon]|nr:hypothetical protein [Candidatus Aenigmarchaeota archaeon]